MRIIFFSYFLGFNNYSVISLTIHKTEVKVNLRNSSKIQLEGIKRNENGEYSEILLLSKGKFQLLYHGRFLYLPHILDVSIHCSHTAWFGRHSLFMTFPPIVAVTTWFRCHYLIYMGLVVSFRGRGTEKEHLKFLITRKSMQPSPVAYSLSRFLWHVATRRIAILRFCAVLCSMGN